MIFDSTQLFAYSPMLILIGMGCLVLLAETFVKGAARAGLAWLSIAGCVAASGHCRTSAASRRATSRGC